MSQTHFFKVFFPNLSTEHLKIPVHFSKHLEGKTSKTFSLMGPSGKTWNVELVDSKDNGLIFQDGWSVFVRDHCVKIGEFFVFKYDGNLHFTVIIFDSSGCEKDSAFCVNSNENTASWSAKFNENKRGRGRPSRRSVGFKDDPAKKVVTIGTEAAPDTVEGRLPTEEWGRNQVRRRNWPRITDQELQKISGDLNSAIVPLFEKILCASDTGPLGRLVLPKACAEAYFPPISHPEGCPLKIQDIQGKEWVFQFRFWLYRNRRVHFLEGVTPCIQSMQLQAGDTVTFSRIDPEGKLVMVFRKASNFVTMQEPLGFGKRTVFTTCPSGSSCLAPDETIPKEMENFLRSMDSKNRRIVESHKPAQEHDTAVLLGGKKGNLGKPLVVITTKHPRHNPGCMCIVCI